MKTLIASAKYDSELANKVREQCYSLSYNDAGNLKQLLSDVYHRLDSRILYVHKKKDGYLMITASGYARFMTFKERIAYIIFGCVPTY